MKKKSALNTKIKLTPKRIRGKIQNVQKIVVKRMNEKNIKPYSLAKRVHELGGEVTEQSIRNFVKGTTKMNSEHLAFVLNALDLEVRPKD